MRPGARTSNYQDNATVRMKSMPSRVRARCTADAAGHIPSARASTLAIVILAAAQLLTCVMPSGALAQMSGNWSTDFDINKQLTTPPATKPSEGPQQGMGTTVVKKKTPQGPVPADAGRIRLVAKLTADGQPVERDLVWRIFEPGTEAGNAGKLIATHVAPAPVVDLKAGTYTVNAAFGRANLTRRFTVTAGAEATEQFVLNAGGLRIKIASTAEKMDGTKAVFDILADERDQNGQRRSILAGAKPGVVIRLNSGIYHVVSTLGDANASIESDLTVEAGKLTEATLSIKAARVTLKLVDRQGGEAQADTQWSVLTKDGRTIKSSVGALPTHIVAPGTYFAVAKSLGQVYRREFAVADGESVQVEVLKE